ncbi:MAG: hypothetical protein ACMG6S_13465 [Byssovorax sp.]
MSARLLNPRSSLLALLGDIRYTLSRIKADPLAERFLSAFEGLRDEWTTVQAQEIENQEELSDAQALVDLVDLQLTAFASRLSTTVHALVKEDRNHPLYLHFFGENSRSVLARPRLGIEMLEMRPWLVSMETSPDPSVQAMAAELGLLVVAAEKAVTALEAVRAKVRAFYDGGARRKLFDRCNEARQSTHEALAKIALEKGGYPREYAGGFFRANAGEAMPPEPTFEGVRQ